MGAMSTLNVVVVSFLLPMGIFWQLNSSTSIVVIAVVSAFLPLASLAYWKLYLWPFWFSPLRKLPEPPVSPLPLEVARLKNQNTEKPNSGWSPFSRPCESGSERTIGHALARMD